MTITHGQMRAAGRELRLRREGVVKKEKSAERPTRPFAKATEKTLKRFASSPTLQEKEQMKRELELRDSGAGKRRANKGPNTPRPFEEAQTRTLRNFVGPK